MAVTVKSISLWRKEVENQVGSLARTLEPVAKAGANLHVLMGYRYPGEGTKAAIELYPVAGKKVTSAAAEAGLSTSSIPTLLVKGDDKPPRARHRPGHRRGRGQHDFLCRSGDWAKVFGSPWVRNGGRRKGGGTANQESGDQEEVKGDEAKKISN